MFFTEPFSQGKYLLFMSADLCMIGCGSLVGGWFALRKKQLAEAFAAWLVTGAMGYATLGTYGLYKLGDCTLLASASMYVAATVSVVVSILLSRAASPEDIARN